MLLAIDSATRVLSLALHDGLQVHAEVTWNTPNRHTVELTPAIDDLLKRAHLSIADLSALAVSQGPGSFNGLRIGFSVAKGLAMARSIPLIAIPTLDVLAAAQPIADADLIAVLQVGRGRVCARTYACRENRWTGQLDLRIASWPGVLDSISTRTIISGEIDDVGRTAIQDSGKPVILSSPAFGLRRASFLAELAYERWRAGHTDDAAAVAPLYLHQPGVPHP